MTEDRLSAYVSTHPEASIGLVMGSEVSNGEKIVGIDVDDDDLVDPVRHAIGNAICAKKGNKGITFFARMPDSLNAGTKRIYQKKNGKKVGKPAVEILGIKAQTVIPPSIHPTTGNPYFWIGKSLLEVKFEDLPLLNLGSIDEITGICEGTVDKITALNDMIWLGEGGGGDTHDICLEAAGAMVRRGWSDSCTFQRLRRAKKESVERAGEVYDWPDEEKVLYGFIKSARDKGFDKEGEESRKRVKRPNMERVMADWAVDYLGGQGFVIQKDDVIRRYEDGHWPILDESLLLRTMYRQFKEAKGYEIESALVALKREEYRPDFGMVPEVNVKDDPKMSRMCLLNGTLDLNTGLLGPHRPEDELMHQLKFDYSDKAECPMWERFIDQMFKGDSKHIDCVHEFMAYSLTPDNSFQKMIFFIGTGANGKGTLIRFWQSLFDISVIGSVNISELNDQRMLTSLVGKMINVSSEQSRFDQISDNRIKQITGGDYVTTRKLYKEAVNAQRIFTKFIGQSNEMPSTADSSDALTRRLILMNCPNQVLVNQDLDLDKKLITERAGVLRKYLIPGRKRLYANGCFSEPPLSEALKTEWRNANENVLYWLTECCEYPAKGQEITSEWTRWTPSRELYMHYSDFCKTFGFRFIANEVQWGQKLKMYNCPSHVKSLHGKSVKMRPIVIKGEKHEY